MSQTPFILTLANHNPFADPAFLRDLAHARQASEARTRHALAPAHPAPRPEPKPQPHSGRKTFDTRQLYRPELRYGHTNRYGE